MANFGCCQGGTLSDLFDDHHRGLPMLMFAFSAFAPTALGPICFGYVGMLEGFRLAAWIQFGLAGLLSIAICLLQGETREDVILSKLAPKLTRESGRPHCATAESKKSRTVGQILQTTLGRPFRLLAFEPILQAWTLYVSFACEHFREKKSHRGCLTLPYRGRLVPVTLVNPHYLHRHLQVQSWRGWPGLHYPNYRCDTRTAAIFAL